MITLGQALRLQNHKGKGVNVCFCSSEEDDFEKVGFVSARTFSEIRDTLSEYNLNKLEVFRIDSENDVITFYVLQKDTENGLDMTLESLCDIENYKGCGVQIKILDADRKLAATFNLHSLQSVKKECGLLLKYKIVRLDSEDNILKVYVVREL